MPGNYKRGILVPVAQLAKIWVAGHPTISFSKKKPVEAMPHTQFIFTFIAHSVRIIPSSEWSFLKYGRYFNLENRLFTKSQCTKPIDTHYYKLPYLWLILCCDKIAVLVNPL
ncbi:hypothetical protein QTP88_002337 [Uroleucon formosanum]